jgi:hypothetical protein
MTLVLSSALLFLYLGNLRSRLYFGGPNWGFLLWLAAYSAITGTGLVLLRKWGAVLLFLPSVLIAGGLLGLALVHSIPLYVAIQGGLYSATLLLIAIVPLRRWHELI